MATHLIIDSDSLFIGPGMECSLGPEVFNISSLTRASCSLPDLPVNYDHYYGYVGRRTEKGPMLCGGYGYNSTGGGNFVPDCFLLVKNGTWLTRPGMKKLRLNARAVDTSSGWWVTGTQQHYHILT